MTGEPHGGDKASGTDGPDEAALENGRLLFAGACDFIAAANNMKVLPPEGLPEICFAGRSNVGKSSLINALTGRKTLARTSQTPGRTRQLIFFSLADRIQLVDLPGYGYARAPKTDIKAWTTLTRKFLAGRASLQRVFLLIDARRGIGPGDSEIMTLLDASAVSWAVVITKADKLKPAALEAVCNDTRSRITTHVAAFPELFVTSAEAATGIAELRAHLGALALPRS
ncbi:MAG: ribosome biogenesis GTP-binding protein YihA/YsxC [Alphaproteobacteria bacterium]|nr:ribosome biogenesis GTP-binding protein YihA/YsxC [Alphaproteobacteria bacterium]